MKSSVLFALIIFFIILITYNYIETKNIPNKLCHFENNGIKIIHDSGFFSCSSERLGCIIDYINKYKKLPIYVNSKQLFNRYKQKYKTKKDITFLFFDNYDNVNVNSLCHFDTAIQRPPQFLDYSSINYNEIKPIIKKYFSLSNNIIDRKNKLKTKYNIDYSNTIAVYFRGTDKSVEITEPKFETYYNKIKTISELNLNKKIIIQTDSAHFLDYIKKKQIKNIIIFDETKPSYLSKGTHKEKRNRYKEIQELLSIISILSECNDIICCSNNVSLWIMLFRGHPRNVHQYLEDKFLN
jgi:hypothetical protein